MGDIAVHPGEDGLGLAERGLELVFQTRNHIEHRDFEDYSHSIVAGGFDVMS